MTVYPVADGGEGTTEALSFGRAAVLPQCITVTGPLGEKVQAKYTIFGTGEEKTAILEMAQAAGLTLVPVSQRNPLKTTTYGVGEMILMQCVRDAKTDRRNWRKCNKRCWYWNVTSTWSELYRYK